MSTPAGADAESRRGRAAAPTPSREPANTATADVWRPTQPPRALPRFGFRISLPNADGSTGAYLELDPEGHFYNYEARQGRPTEWVVLVREDFSLRVARDGRVQFFLRPSDGELVDPDDDVAHGSRPAQDLHCHLTVGAELRCTHEDGNESFVLSVRDGHIVGRHDSMPGQQQEMNAVEPDPRTDDERRLVLFLWAAYLVPTDTGSHDGDSGFFDGPN
jgi:hypothetical protein